VCTARRAPIRCYSSASGGRIHVVSKKTVSSTVPEDDTPAVPAPKAAQARYMKARGYKNAAIAEALGVKVRQVSRYLAAAPEPEPVGQSVEPTPEATQRRSRAAVERSKAVLRDRSSGQYRKKNSGGTIGPILWVDSLTGEVGEFGRAADGMSEGRVGDMREDGKILTSSYVARDAPGTRFHTDSYVDRRRRERLERRIRAEGADLEARPGFLIEAHVTGRTVTYVEVPE
jgi:hypothetical protein